MEPVWALRARTDHKRKVCERREDRKEGGELSFKKRVRRWAVLTSVLCGKHVPQV